MDDAEAVIIRDDDPRSRLVTLVATLAVLILGAGTAVAIMRSGEPAPANLGDASASAAPVPSPTTPPPGLEVLDSPTAAARVSADVLLEVANRELARSELSGGWPIEDERPVYVVNGTIREQRRLVVADQVLAFRLSEDADGVVLRFLPAAAALGSDPPFVTGTVDRVATTVAMDPDAALLHVDLGRQRFAGEAITVRLSMRYSLVDASTLGGDGPVGYGLLSRDDNVSVLSHWLPLLTFDSSPLLAMGDLGAFPTAIWSLEIVHGGVLATGGLEGPCRVDVDNCTKVTGVGLRDMGMLVLDAASVTEELVDGHTIRVVHQPGVAPADAVAVLAETVAAVRLYQDLFGDLAWPQTDVVGTPLSRGAAGMEYPGMFILRDDLWGSHQGSFGTYVIAHEVAHQWFHALVGNSSLSDPVIDESIAQYLSYVYYTQFVGQGAADDLATGMLERWQDGLASGFRNDPPAQALAEFESDAAYGAIVYGRAPFAFIEADRELGRDVVVRLLSDVVQGHALRRVTVADVRRIAEGVHPRLAELLEQWWVSEDPDA